MIGAKTSAANCVSYALEVAIKAPCERVWHALIEETNVWWLPDFHMVDAQSVVSFDPQPGGQGLVENLDQGGGLLWYTVQLHLPQEFKIYLVGFIAPDWGGPATSHLKLALEAGGEGCILKVTDAQHGNVNESSIQSLSDGWTQLFHSGLKEWVEQGTRQDRIA